MPILCLSMLSGKIAMLKKSVIIGGRHSTSISLEKEFYAELQEIAQKRALSINQIITEIDNHRNDDNNLSSAIRIYILQTIKNSPK